jgi:hypothetical protein
MIRFILLDMKDSCLKPQFKPQRTQRTQRNCGIYHLARFHPLDEMRFASNLLLFLCDLCVLCGQLSFSGLFL